jgi:aryl-alcohol dehydrogenase-like predicted oxidoreductase
MNGLQIGLGTVQFGMDYGISNENGVPEEEEISAILGAASEAGIRYIDTAEAYGNAQVRLGREDLSSFELIGKVAAGRPSWEIQSSVQQSLEELRIQQFHALLAHEFRDPMSDYAWWAEMLSLKQKGLTKKIGFSVYYPEQLDEIAKRQLPFEFVQLPFNLYDRRFEDRFEDLRRAGVEIHVRSIFLQGLFFIPPEELSSHFNQIRDQHGLLHEQSHAFELGIAEACLSLALLSNAIDCVVVGVTSLAELSEIVRAGQNILDNPERYSLPDFRISDEKIILPQNWK